MERDIGIEMISIPARYWKWSGGPNTILEDDLPIGVRVPVATHTLIWSNVVAPPYETIRALRGTVNADAILGALPGCLLFVAQRSRRSTSSTARFATRCNTCSRRRRCR